MRRAALAVLAFVLAGCGAAKSPAVANVGTTTRTATRDATSAAIGDPALAYSRCMRANGVRGFPDPGPDGGFQFQAGSDTSPSSPAFEKARAKCQSLMPGLAPGTVTHPSAQWLARMIEAAQCMRAHGVPSFPDPTTTIPPMPTGGNGLISDIDGAVFEFPTSIDEQSPAFIHAARVCGFPLHNH